MATLGSLLFFIRAKNSEFKQRMDESKRKVKEFDDGVQKSKKELQDWTGKAKKAGMALTAFAAAVGAGSYKLAQIAGEAEDTQGKFEAVFKGMESEASAFVTSFSRKFDMAESSVEEWMSKLKDTFDPLGIAAEKSLEWGKALTALALDAKTFYPELTSVGDAINRFTSFLVGNHEAVRVMGVVVNETMIKNEAYRLGIAKTGEELTEVQKMTARYHLLLNGLENATGNATRELENFNMAQTQLKEIAKETAEVFGDDVMPTFVKLLNTIKNFLKWLRDLPPELRKTISQATILSGIIAGLTGPLLLIVGYLPQIARGLNLVKKAFLPFLAKGAIVIGLIALYQWIVSVRNEIAGLNRDINSFDLTQAKKELLEVSAEIERLETLFQEASADPRDYKEQMLPPYLKTQMQIYQDLLDKREELLKLIELLEVPEPEEPTKQEVVLPEITSGLVDRDKLFRQYEEDMELLDLEGYKREVKSIQQQMKKEVEDAERAKNEALKKAQEDGLAPDSDDYKQIEKDWDKLIKLIEQYWERRTGNVIKKAKDESLAIEKEYQDKIALMGKEGLDRELELLKQKKEAAIKEAKDEVKGIETIGEIDALDEINELYELKEQQIRERYRKEEEQRLKSWNERYILLTKEGLERELEENRIARESALAEAQKLAIESNESKLEAQEQFRQEEIKINKVFDEQAAQIRERYHESEMQAELRKQQFLLQQREISYYDYLAYIEKQLEAEEKYSDTWYSLMQERQNTLNTIVQNELKHYQEQSEEMFKDENERITWLIDKLMILKEHYADNNIIVYLLGEEIKKLRDNIADPPAEDSLNWLENIFVAVGYKAEEAQQNFQDFRDALVDGLMDAINKGENFLATLKNIADQIADMVVKRGIVEPFVDWMLTGIGLDVGHSGALVTTSGLVKDLPSYHSGGKIPGLAADERIIKVLTGERILSRNQNKKFEDGEYGKVENHYSISINAVDAASFTELVKRNPEAITGVVAGDYQRNGVIRKIIKGGP